MKVRALGLLAIAKALFAPIVSGAQQIQDGVSSDECKALPPRPGVTELLNKPIPGVPSKCIRVNQIVIKPHQNVGCHTHPGDEFGIVLEGSLVLQKDDGPYESAPKDFSVSRGTSMDVKNETDSNATLISVLIIDANVSPLMYCDGKRGHH